MTLSGFTFIRNAITYDFPVVEAIQSVLPLVDEFVVNVGQSDDGTHELISSIPSDKIRIIESMWDDTLRKDGRIFGQQQDRALAACRGDWALLVQADEVVHEDDHAGIREALERYGDDESVLGLVFRMLHFKGDYWTVDPWMYRWATRLIRHQRGTTSAADGCDFVAQGCGRMLKSGPSARRMSARIFHYGWVKSRPVLCDKVAFQKSRHDGERLSQREIDEEAVRAAELPTYDILKTFRGSHPAVMRDRIHGAVPLRSRRNRWLNLRFYREVLRHGFKG